MDIELLKMGPPLREFRQSWFRGLVETEESKRKTAYWETWNAGYAAALKDVQTLRREAGA
jgi:hypothetical protein